MAEIIEELKDIPGVLGACLFHGQKGLVQTNMPADFTADKLTEVGKLLMKIQSAGRMNFPDLNDLSMHYEDSVILGRELEENLMVFTLCTPSYNQNLVTTTLNLLQQKRIRPKASESAGTKNEKMPQVLDELKAHLPKILGPMASIIFDEAVETWEEQGNSSIDNINSLLLLINEEIGDEGKIAYYANMIAPILGKY
jgi:hypothetical protein